MSTPTYPVTVQLTGGDSNAFMLIGTVAKALRREVGTDAADAFSREAMNCGSYDELLQFIMATVEVV